MNPLSSNTFVTSASQHGDLPTRENDKPFSDIGQIQALDTIARQAANLKKDHQDLCSLSENLRLLSNTTPQEVQVIAQERSVIKKQLSQLRSKLPSLKKNLAKSEKNRDAQTEIMETLHRKLLVAQKNLTLSEVKKSQDQDAASTQQRRPALKKLAPKEKDPADQERIDKLNANKNDLHEKHKKLSLLKTNLYENSKKINSAIKKETDAEALHVNLLNNAMNKWAPDIGVQNEWIQNDIFSRGQKIGVPEALFQNPEANKSALFNAYLERITILHSLNDGSHTRILQSYLKAGCTSTYYEVTKVLTYFIGNKKSHHLLQGSAFQVARQLSKKILLEGAALPTSIRDIESLASPNFHQFCDYVKDNLAQLTDAMARKRNKMKFENSTLSREEIETTHQQYEALSQFIGDNKSQFFDGYCTFCCIAVTNLYNDAQSLLDQAKIHKNKINSLKIELENNLKLSEKFQEKINSNLASIYAIEKEMSALSIQPAIPAENQTEVDYPSIVSSWFGGITLKRDAYPDIKLSREKSKIEALINQHQEALARYENEEQTQLDAADELQRTELSITQFERELDILKSKRTGVIQEKKLDKESLKEKIESLRLALTRAKADLSENPCIGKLISETALKRTLQRHLEQNIDQLHERALTTGRTATYHSLGEFLNALVNVHQKMQIRFPELVSASSKAEFDTAFSKLGSPQDLLCMHAQVVGEGVRFGRADDQQKTVNSSVSCYSMKWSEKSKAVVIKHLYPWIAPSH